MRGITNRGQTCYLAAALQCLLFSPQLINYFLTSPCLDEDQNKRKKNAVLLVNAVSDLARHTWLDPTDDTVPPPLLDPAPVLIALGKNVKQFNKGPGVQQDAHECLLALLDTMHQGLSRLKRVEHSVARAALANKAAALAAWDAACTTDYSFLRELYVGQIQTGEHTYDHFWSITLPFTTENRENGTTLSLDHMLGKHFAATPVTYAPLLLLIHFNRFDSTGTKMDTFVHYGIEVDLGGDTYELYTVILHSGQSEGGHYTAMVCHQQHWMHCDDSQCTPVAEMNSIIQKDAYVLCYKKKAR